MFTYFFSRLYILNTRLHAYPPARNHINNVRTHLEKDGKTMHETLKMLFIFYVRNEAENKITLMNGFALSNYIFIRNMFSYFRLI